MIWGDEESEGDERYGGGGDGGEGERGSDVWLIIPSSVRLRVCVPACMSLHFDEMMKFWLMRVSSPTFFCSVCLNVRSCKRLCAQ